MRYYNPSSEHAIIPDGRGGMVDLPPGGAVEGPYFEHFRSLGILVSLQELRELRAREWAMKAKMEHGQAVAGVPLDFGVRVPERVVEELVTIWNGTFACRLCDRFATMKWQDMQWHLERVHLRTAEEPKWFETLDGPGRESEAEDDEVYNQEPESQVQTCQFCGRTFVDEQALARHVERNHAQLRELMDTPVER